VKSTKAIAEQIEKAMESVTKGRWCQFHPSYASEAKGAPLALWDTSHDTSAVSNDFRVRLATFKRADDAAYVDAVQPANIRILLSALSEAEAGWEREAKLATDMALDADAEHARAVKAGAERDQLKKDLDATNAALSLYGYGVDTHAAVLAALEAVKDLSRENRARAEKAEAELAHARIKLASYKASAEAHLSRLDEVKRLYDQVRDLEAELAQARKMAKDNLEKLPAAFEVLDRENGTCITQSEEAALATGFESNGLYRCTSAERAHKTEEEQK
jgi:hypothetical protein